MNLASQVGVEATTMGVMVSSALFGMMFGAIGLGVLGDKLGRRLAIAVCVLLFSVFTAAAGVARDPITFGVLRFIAGLGIGGVLPLCTALLTEYASASVCARFITIAACGYSIGGGLAALIGKALMEVFGWQVVFFAAGAPLILIPFILRFVPESLPFLLKQKRDAEVRRIVSKLAPGQELQAQGQFVVPQEDEGEKAPIGRLFLDGRAFSSLMFCLAFLTSLFTVYALSSWLTKLLAMSGFSIGSALNLVLATSIGGVVGALSSGWLADKLHIKWVLMACYMLTGVLGDRDGLRDLAVDGPVCSGRGRRVLAKHEHPDLFLRLSVLSKLGLHDRRRLCVGGRAHWWNRCADSDGLAGVASAAATAKLRGDRGGPCVWRGRDPVRQRWPLGVDTSLRRCHGHQPVRGARSAPRLVGTRLT